MPSGDVLFDCHIRTAKAITHPIHPIREIHFLLDVFLCSLKFTKLTAPKISKNPELPIIAILERSKMLAIIKVKTAVMINPSRGLFQIFLSSFFGNSPVFAII